MLETADRRVPLSIDDLHQFLLGDVLQGAFTATLEDGLDKWFSKSADVIPHWNDNLIIWERT